MPPRIGYLLPTREQILIAQPQASPLLELAVRAERLGFDSLWMGEHPIIPVHSSSPAPGSSGGSIPDRSYWIPGSYAPTWSENRHSF